MNSIQHASLLAGLLRSCLSQVTTLEAKTYTSSIYSCWLSTLGAALFCMFAILAAFLLPLLTPHRFEYSDMKRLRTYLLGAVTLVNIAVVLIWVIQMTTAHRDVVDDLELQLLNSMDTFLGKALDDAFKMVKQAANIWTFTGGALSDLHSLGTWMTPVMQDFYISSSLSTLRLGTTTGLEQGANGTSVGVRVLSRTLDGSGNCLKTFLPDGLSSDDVQFADVCNYDPRYTTWFEAGLDSIKYGVNNTLVIGDVYTIGETLRLGMGVATKLVQGSFAGVMTAEFVLDSVGAYFGSLIRGLDGTLFIASVDQTGQQDGLLLVSSRESISTIGLCRTSTDASIKKATDLIYDQTKYGTFYHVQADQDPVLLGKVLRDHVIVKASNASLTPGLLNIASLPREQLYSKFERWQDLTVSMAVLCMLAIWAISYRQCVRLEWRLETRESMATEERPQEASESEHEPDAMIQLYRLTRSAMLLLGQHREHGRQAIHQNDQARHLELESLPLSLADHHLK